MTRGDDFKATIQLYEEDENEVLTPVNLTDYTAKSQIRASTALTAELLAEFTCVFTSRLEGQIEISLTSAQTALLPAKSSWDIEITSPDNWKTTVAGGSIVVAPDVTRDE